MKLLTISKRNKPVEPVRQSLVKNGVLGVSSNPRRTVHYMVEVILVPS